MKEIEELNNTFKKTLDQNSMEFFANIREFQVLALTYWPELFRYICSIENLSEESGLNKKENHELRSLLRGVFEPGRHNCLCWPDSAPCTRCRVELKIGKKNK